MSERQFMTIGSRGARVMRFSMPVLLLSLAAACATDPAPIAEDEQVAVETQQACTPRRGVGCTIQRPVGWGENGVACVERPETPIHRADLQTYTATAVPSHLLGAGSTVLKCDGGCLVTLEKHCRKGPPNEP